jgi:hypothetical protein
MAKPEVPHFGYPFKFGVDRHVAVVEQDTIEDVCNCLAVAFLTENGFRPEVPTFGVPWQVFETQPLDLEMLIGEVQEWEDRAEMIMSQMPDVRDPLIDRVTAVTSLRRATLGA